MPELYLIAEIAGRTVAIGSDQIESVVDIGEVTAVPRAPRQVLGLAALRSRVVTVIDSQAALGMPPNPAARRAVISLVDGHHYAMLLDALDDVAPFAAAPLGGGITLDPLWARAARGVIERAGEPILILDLAALVPEPA